MRFVATAVASLALAWAATALAEPLPPVTDAALVRLLNDFEMLATLSGDPPLRVRVIRLRDRGECDGTPESCPRQTLYVAVSGYDEAPDQALYLLPKAHHWRFVAWTHVPEREGPDDFVRLTLERDDPSPTPESGWWATTRLELAVNPWRASMTPMAP